MIGCRHGAKNKLSKNYLYLAEKYGAVVHELQQVTEVRPMADGGYGVKRGIRASGAASLSTNYTTAQVILSAHAFGTAKLLHLMRHEGIWIGSRITWASGPGTNSEALSTVRGLTPRGRATPTSSEHPARWRSPRPYGPTTTPASSRSITASAAT